MEDRYLVLRCKRGCRRSFARIYSKYRQDLAHLAIALLNDTAAAEDVVHDVFVGFAQGLSQFRLTGLGSALLLDLYSFGPYYWFMLEESTFVSAKGAKTGWTSKHVERRCHECEAPNSA